MIISICPNCKAKVSLGSKPRLGDRVDCFECDTELELVWLDPPELDWPWNYDDDETMIYDDLNIDQYAS
jgi:lysine biosynthesis protein LysW